MLLDTANDTSMLSHFCTDLTVVLTKQMRFEKTPWSCNKSFRLLPGELGLVGQAFPGLILNRIGFPSGG